MTDLAINGGLPVRKEAFPHWPFFEEDEIAAVSAVLQSGNVNYWTGKEGLLFEKEFAASIGVNYAVAVMNGTVALEAVLMAMGIGCGDEVIVTPRSYIASASCVVMLGAKPVFADVDRDSQNITADTIKKVITSRTRAIIAVHLTGWPCEMDAIMSLAKKHGLAVIEDCAQASGAYYKGRPIGSFGAAAAFSFCQDKIMTTGGEGGMVVMHDKDIWSKVWSYKDHGKSYGAVYSNDMKPGPAFKWLHESFGTNWRMTELQAAIGRIQLRKLPDWIEKRRHNADILTKAFLNIPALRVTTPPEDVKHAYYKYYAFVKPDMLKTGWDRERIIIAINSEGIPCFPGSCSEMYLEKAFDTDGMRPKKRLPIAEELGDTAIMFLVHPTLSENDMRDVVKAVEKVMAAAINNKIIRSETIGKVMKTYNYIVLKVMQRSNGHKSRKRFFDFSSSLILMAIIAIPLFIIAVAVKLTSPGPVILWSKRVGKDNEIFLMPKLRTMHIGSPDVATHLLEDYDIYLTSIGSFLRTASLDELPQLWSVLKGEMSFVGPRPALYNQDDLVALRTKKGVHKLIPGITGWAQINGRDDIPIPLKVEYDEYYLKNRSLFFDLKILWNTFFKVIKKEGVSH